MKKLSRQLKKRRRLLLERYDEETLHQLRITLRRMRGGLKHETGDEPRRLRKELGALADASNAARDWDTLVSHAKELLSSKQFKRMSSWLRTNQESAHEQVRDLLESEQWSTTLSRWKAYAKRADKPSPGSEDRGKRKSRQVIERVVKTRGRALDTGRNRDWHKLRIAIKDFRYHLDEQPKKKRTPQVREAIQVSKQLQDELGTWHDTVVHRQLLRQKEHGADPTIAILEHKLVREGEVCLERVRSILVEPALERALGPTRR